MTVRTSRKSITFTRPFSLSGFATVQPAGTYEVETEEELLEGLSLPAYRRTATTMILPSQPGSMILAEIVTIDPLELNAALERDAIAGQSADGATTDADLLIDDVRHGAVRRGRLTLSGLNAQLHALVAAGMAAAARMTLGFTAGGIFQPFHPSMRASTLKKLFRQGETR